MNRPVIWTACALVLVAAVPFVWKTVVLDMPLRPASESKVWRVELRVDARGTRTPGSVSILLPSADQGQLILDEQVDSAGLVYSERLDNGQRIGMWLGRVGELDRLSYTFRVHLLPDRASPPQTPTEADSAAVGISVPPAVVDQVLRRLGVTIGDDVEATVARVFGFVSHEVESAPGASDDDLLTLASREGSELGRARLLYTLLRAASVEARLITAIDLRAGSRGYLMPYVEARTLRGWTALHPPSEEPGKLPADIVILSRADTPLVWTSGIDAWNPSIRVLRESVRAEEVVTFMTPPSAFWQALSLYRLPLAAQSSLQTLLLIPLASLVAAVYRNLIGMRTFGTFMPILLAIALREVDLLTGLALITTVLAVGTAGRLVLDKLRLLFVPRICLLLCLVVLGIMVLAQVSHAYGGKDLMTGLLFPIVILSMLIERIAVTTMEEGPRSAATLLGGSFLVAASAYPIFHSKLAAHLFFGFPELIFGVMALLVLIGGYTGYRAVELLRFRSLVREGEN